MELIIQCLRNEKCLLYASVSHVMQEDPAANQNEASNNMLEVVTSQVFKGFFLFYFVSVTERTIERFIMDCLSACLSMLFGLDVFSYFCLHYHEWPRQKDASGVMVPVARVPL